MQAAPQDFLASPGNWMQWISDYGGTATAGPNFSWVLATRALRRMKGLDLSTLTLALNGAEPVDPTAVEAFVAAAAPFGFNAGRRVPGVRHGRGGDRRRVPAAASRAWSCDTVDRACSSATASPSRSTSADADEELDVRRLPLLGTAVPGLEMRIVDPDDVRASCPSARSASCCSAARR